MFSTATYKCCVHADHHHVTDYHSGDITCTGCGMVLESSIIDDRPTNTKDLSFEQGDAMEMSRNGYLFNTLGGSNVRGWVRKAAQFAEQRSQDHLTLGNRKQLHDLKDTIFRLQLSTSVQECAEEAVKLFWKANSDHMYVREKQRDYLNMACIYHACKQLGVSRSLAELSSACNMYEMNVRKAYKHLHEVLFHAGGDVDSSPETWQEKRQEDASGVTGYFSRWCSQLGYKPSVAMECKARFHQIPESLYRGRKPTVIAAAVVCLVKGSEVTNPKLKSVCKVTPQSAKELASVFRGHGK